MPFLLSSESQGAAPGSLDLLASSSHTGEARGSPRRQAIFVWATFLEHSLCAKLYPSHVGMSTHLTLKQHSAAGVCKSPRFTDVHTEAQGARLTKGTG